MFLTFSENFSSIRSVVQEKIASEHFERSELMSKRSDRAEIARWFSENYSSIRPAVQEEFVWYEKGRKKERKKKERKKETKKETKFQ